MFDCRDEDDSNNNLNKAKMDKVSNIEQKRSSMCNNYIDLKIVQTHQEEHAESLEVALNTITRNVTNKEQLNDSLI